MTDGRISESGTFEELLSHAGAFSDFLKMYFQEQRDDIAGEGVYCLFYSCCSPSVVMSLYNFTYCIMFPDLSTQGDLRRQVSNIIQAEMHHSLRLEMDDRCFTLSIL